MSPQLPWSFAACANERYAPGLEILISGIAKFASAGHELNFYVIDCGLLKETQSRILQRIAGFEMVHVSFVEPPMEMFNTVQIHRYHISSYLRLALPVICRDSRIVYLDSDVVVLGDLLPLIRSIHHSSEPVSAVSDFETRSPAQDSEVIAKAHDLEDHPHYFNAGVLGMDLDALRKEDFTAKACDLLSRLGKHAQFADQSAFNALLAGRWSELDAKWNTPAWVFDQQADNQVPGILHYTNSAPWLQRHYRPSQALFERAAMELGVTLPKPEKDLSRTIPTALTKWLVAPARVLWHGLRGMKAARQGNPKKATGEHHIMLHWLRYFTGGPARVLRYCRRIREIRDPAFQIFSYRP